MTNIIQVDIPVLIVVWITADVDADIANRIPNNTDMMILVNMNMMHTIKLTALIIVPLKAVPLKDEVMEDMPVEAVKDSQDVVVAEAIKDTQDVVAAEDPIKAEDPFKDADNLTVIVEAPTTTNVKVNSSITSTIRTNIIMMEVIIRKNLVEEKLIGWMACEPGL